MDTDKHRWETNLITEAVNGAAYQVSNTLGNGFLEKVYENALAIEIRKNKLQVIQQHPIPVRYEGAVVGEFVADLFVQDEILVELKTVKALDEIHLAQCLHYLKAHRLARVFIDQFWKPKGGNQTHHVMNLSPHLCLSVSICG